MNARYRMLGVPLTTMNFDAKIGNNAIGETKTESKENIRIWKKTRVTSMKLRNNNLAPIKADAMDHNKDRVKEI